MKARHASESKKAKEGNGPADCKAEQGDIMVRMVAIRREKVDVQEVPGAAEAGDQRLLRRGLRLGTRQLSRWC